MTKQRVTNTALFKLLIAELGERGQAKLELGADVSRSTIRDILRGVVPGDAVRGRIAAFFNCNEEEIWPLLALGKTAA